MGGWKWGEPPGHPALGGKSSWGRSEETSPEKVRQAREAAEGPAPRRWCPTEDPASTPPDSQGSGVPQTTVGFPQFILSAGRRHPSPCVSGVAGGPPGSPGLSLPICIMGVVRRACTALSAQGGRVWTRCESVIHADTWGVKDHSGVKGQRREHWTGRPGAQLCVILKGSPLWSGGVDSWIPKGPSSSLFPRTVKGSELMMA